MSRALFLTAIIFFFLSIYLQAQDWHFVDESASRLPDTNTISQAVDGGDINGDGAIDILVGMETFPFGVSGMAQLLLNGEQGYYFIADSSYFPQRID